MINLIRGRRYLITEKVTGFNKGEIVEFTICDEDSTDSYTLFYPLGSWNSYYHPKDKVEPLDNYFKDIYEPKQEEVDYLNMIYNTEYTIKDIITSERRL